MLVTRSGYERIERIRLHHLPEETGLDYTFEKLIESDVDCVISFRDVAKSRFCSCASMSWLFKDL